MKRSSHLVLLFCSFLKIYAQNYPNNKTINGNNYEGSTERAIKTTDYGLIIKQNGKEIIYYCNSSKEITVHEIPFQLLLENLSNNISTITVRDCDKTVLLGEVVTDIRGDAELYINHKINITQLKIKNVNECLLGPLLGGLQILMNGNISIYIENVKRIDTFPNDFIMSVPYPNKHGNNKMESLFLTLRNVTIGKVEENAISWSEDQIPLRMIWEDVTVENISSNAINFDINYPIRNIKEYPFNYIYIINSTFKTLPYNVIIGAGSDFHFLNNKVNVITPSAINITAKDIKICNNEFNYVHNFSFCSISKGEGATLDFSSNKINSSELTAIYFGLFDSTDVKGLNISFRFNHFKCVNSKWIRNPKNEQNTTLDVYETISVKYSDILKFENLFYENTDNICSDNEIKCSENAEEYPVLSIKKYHDYYKLFKDDWDRYCTDYTIGSYIVYSSIIVICIISIICVIYLAITTRGQFLYSKTKDQDTHL